MPWERQHFLAAFRMSPTGYGLRRYLQREIVGRYMEAIGSGYAHVLMPRFGTPLSQDRVEKGIETLDTRWRKEWYGRGRQKPGKTHPGPAELGKRLAPLQQQALIEELLALAPEQAEEQVGEE